MYSRLFLGYQHCKIHYMLIVPLVERVFVKFINDLTCMCVKNSKMSGLKYLLAIRSMLMICNVLKMCCSQRIIYSYLITLFWQSKLKCLLCRVVERYLVLI